MQMLNNQLILVYVLDVLDALWSEKSQCNHVLASKVELIYSLYYYKEILSR